MSGSKVQRPKDTVQQGIIQTLSEFAKLTRFYNLDLVASGKAAQFPEPIGAGGSGYPVAFAPAEIEVEAHNRLSWILVHIFPRSW